LLLFLELRSCKLLCNACANSNFACAKERARSADTLLDGTRDNTDGKSLPPSGTFLQAPKNLPQTLAWQLHCYL